MATNDIFLIDSFTGEDCRGNSHLVFLSREGRGRTEDWQKVRRQKALSTELAPYILVFIEFEQHSRSALLRFFHRGHEVSRCGSGSLAAAHVLTEQDKTSDIYWCHTVSGRIRLGKRRAHCFFESETLPLFSSNCMLPWSGVIDRPLRSVTLIGAPTDYCLLVLRDEKALRGCTVNAAALCRITRRALIVTAASSRATDDYVLRYFNPQYGQYEDAATGSANAMAAGYWQARLNKNTIKGRQLSRSGGRFVVRRCGKRQRVYGETIQRELSAVADIPLARILHE